MPTISATRHEVSDRFEVLGFTIKTGRKPYFQVVLASDLDAVRDKGKRTPDSFWASNPISAERGEAVYLVPPEVLKRFAGQPRLFYGLATFADANRREPEVVSEPNESGPWINLGAYTGRSFRRTMTLRPPRRGENGNGYGGSKPQEMEWAGDLARPGTESIPASPASENSRNGQANGNGTHGNGRTNGNGTSKSGTPPPVVSAGITYDDGFGEMPPETIAESVEDYGIDGPLEEVGPTAEGLAHGRALSVTPEYPGATSFVEARHFQRPNQPRAINRIVIHITDGHGPARGTADYFADPQRWYRVDEENGELQMEFDGDRCTRFRTGKKWKECVGGRTKLQNGHTLALARIPVSAHYVVGQDGQVIQMVRNGDIAYHANAANTDSIGIEHGARTPKEFGPSDPGLFPTDAQYRASAQLVCWLAGRLGIAKDRTHILGHAEADPATSHTQCPNAVWDWQKFMGMVTDGSCDPTVAGAAQSFRGEHHIWPPSTDRRPASTRAFGDQPFAVYWNDVQLVPQQSNMSCWAAAAAMVVGWNRMISIDPQEIANGTGIWGAYHNGLYPRDHAALAEAWGLVKEPPQSYTLDRWRELLERYGPLWIGVAVPSGHAVVVTGLESDGSIAGTTVHYHDPWPPGAGAKDQTKSFAQFIQEYEARITTNGDTVNVQVIHSAGTGNHQIASATQSYSGALEFVGFPPDGVISMRREFEANKAAGSPKNCITITNAGLRKLYGPVLKTDTGGDRALASTCQDTMAKLVSYGLAESPTIFEFNDARGRLTKGVVRPETLQQSVEAWLMNEAEKSKSCAWYIFGLSIMDGYHSVVLALDFCGLGDPLTKLYWCDQIYSGWDDVTGSLDARLKERTQAWWDPLPADKKAKTRVTVWPLLPGDPPTTTQGFSTTARRGRRLAKPFTTEGEEGIEGMEEESAIVSRPQSGDECSDAFCPVSRANEASSGNFTLEEFRCRDGTAVPENFRGNVQEVMDNLEVLRAELGRPITINSGYRTCSYNSTLEGAASKSRHLCGQAADIRVAENTPAQVHATIERLIAANRMKQGGLGLYNTFVHYDVRGTKARWDRTTPASAAATLGVVVNRVLPFSTPPPGSNPGSTTAAALSEAGTFSAAPTVGPFKLLPADVSSRLTTLVTDPDVIDQARLNLCGPAAFFNILLRRDPVSFTRYAIDLFKTGTGSIGGLSVRPGADLKAQTYRSSWGCPSTEWMAMSALRDSENALLDFEGTPEEDVAGMTTPAELADWFAATGIYNSVRDEGNWVVTKGIPHALGLSPGANTDIALLINAHILGTASASRKKSDEFILSAFPNHFVVLKTPITARSGMIEFQCWTWASLYAVSVDQSTFDANYYGAVIGQV